MTATSTPNKELFVEVLAHIERDPNAWNQNQWISLGYIDGQLCGTAGCMAGWACILGDIAGQPVVDEDSYDMLAKYGNDDTAQWRKADGDTTPVDAFAGELLGIDDLDGEEDSDLSWAVNELFSGSSEMDDLYDHSAVILDMPEDELRGLVAARVAELDEQAVKRALLAHAVS